MLKYLMILLCLIFTFAINTTIVPYQNSKSKYSYGSEIDVISYSMETQNLIIKNDISKTEEKKITKDLYNDLREYINSHSLDLFYDNETKHEIHIDYDYNNDKFVFSIENFDNRESFVRFI